MTIVKSDHDSSQTPVSFQYNFQKFAKCSTKFSIVKSDYDLIAKSDYDLHTYLYCITIRNTLPYSRYLYHIISCTTHSISLTLYLIFYHGGTSPNKSLGRHISYTWREAQSLLRLFLEWWDKGLHSKIQLLFKIY